MLVSQFTCLFYACEATVFPLYYNLLDLSAIIIIHSVGRITVDRRRIGEGMGIGGGRRGL